MARTKLHAVQRMIRKDDGGFVYRYLVYKPFTSKQQSTWTTNIAKASRWMNPHDARTYLEEVRKEYRITDALTVVEA